MAKSRVLKISKILNRSKDDENHPQLDFIQETQNIIKSYTSNSKTDPEPVIPPTRDQNTSPTNDMVKIKAEDSDFDFLNTAKGNSELGTTRYTDSAQPDTSTQHNSTQKILVQEGVLSISTLETQNTLNFNPAQPDTKLNTGIITDNLNNDSLLNKKSNLNKEILATNSENIASSNINFKIPYSAQPDTDTRHNSTHQLGTTQHNPTQNKKKKEFSEIQPGTTRHNPTPGPAQPDTTTRHKKDHEFDFIDHQKKINNLSGTSAQILSFLCKKCLDTGTNRVTISYRILSELTNVNINSIPTTCKRLRNSGFFEISGPQGGSQAVRHFDIFDLTIRAFATDFINPKIATNVLVQLGTTQHNNSAQPDTWADTSASSMYVGINNNTIHTIQEQVLENDIQNPWDDLLGIDFSSVEKWGIRRSVIETFKKNKWILTREQLEEHMERFVRYFTDKEFEKRREPIKSPYSFFLGAIKAISKGEPDPICDVKTNIEIAQQLAVQNKLKEMELRRREAEAIEKQLEQFKDTEFEHWELSLSDEQKITIAPTNGIAKLGSFGHKQLLKSYFTENVWPDIKHEVLKAPIM